MTNTEINDAVAKRMGWVQCCNPRTMEIGNIVDCFGWSKGGSHFHAPYPDYCGSIAAAWEIVDKLNENGGEFNLMYGFDAYDPLGPRKWCCSYFSVHEKGFGAYAPTAPMAICLAFLKLE